MLKRSHFPRILLVIGLGLCGGIASAQMDSATTDEPAYMARLAHQSMLLDGFAKPSGGLVAVGERGHILLSDDGGRSWKQSPVPTRTTLTSVYFHDDQHGWAVGHDGVILRTMDGGSAWEKVNFDPDDQRPLFGVYFTDADNGIAVGAYGLYMTSADAGASWEVADLQRVPLPAPAADDTDQAGEAEQDLEDDFGDEDEFFDYHLNHIAADDSGRLLIAAESGHLFRSDDAGATWFSLETPYEGSYYATVPLGGDALLLLGMRGNLFASADAGLSFTRVETGTKELLGGGLRLADGRVVLVGMAGVVLVSDNGGRSMLLAAQADRKGLATVIDAGGGAVVLLGEAGAQRREASQF